MSKTNPLLAFILLIAALSLAGFNSHEPALRQQGTSITWSKEEIIKEKEDARSLSFFPVIAADPYGGVHLFWTEDQVIYYMHKDTQGWSTPIDIVWSEGGGLTFPSVVIDRNGILHLVWAAYGIIYHKSVPSWEATDLHKWSEEKAIGVLGNLQTPIRIGVDNENRLHVLFADWGGKTGKTLVGNVYHIMSSDGGETWSDFEQVSSVPKGDLATDPRMAFDSKGQTHIVWGQMTPSLEGAQRGVYTTRLNQSGQAINPIIELDHRRLEEKWMMAINIAVTKDDAIHTVWVCGESAKRCGTWSNDGGLSWANPENIFGDLMGLSGWDALFLDGSGQLYWLTVLRYPQAMWYSFWDGAQWESPPLVASTDQNMQLGENVMTAVGQGNKIYVTAQLGHKIIYMEGESNAPNETAQPVPATVKTPVATMIAETGAPILTSTSNRMNATPLAIANQKPMTGLSGLNVYLVSILSVFFLFSVVFLVRAIKHR